MKKKVLIVGLLVIVIIIAAVLWIYQTEVRPGEKINPFARTWDIHAALSAALQENNPKICDKINKGHVIQDYGVSPKQAREECKYTYVIVKGDLDYCLTLSSTSPLGAVSTRDVCVRELALKLNDSELCDLMPSTDYISLCKQTIAGSREEGGRCLSNANCQNLDCSKYPTKQPKGFDVGFCTFNGERVCFKNTCRCQLVCT
ncbi:MAG: hypothetical protein HY435_02740 [Candidatus Liptonbacteria bacterium]|nr:hypothetical protein [Candidatus Liptonbacteria bacterium]